MFLYFVKVKQTPEQEIEEPISFLGLILMSFVWEIAIMPILEIIFQIDLLPGKLRIKDRKSYNLLMGIEFGVYIIELITIGIKI